jgi:hypothetical protein
MIGKRKASTIGNLNFRENRRIRFPLSAFRFPVSRA